MENLNPDEERSKFPHASPKFEAFPPDAKYDLMKRSEIMRFNKKEVILHGHDFSTDAYFIPQGLIMCYEQKGDDKIVKWVRGDSDWAFAQVAENYTVSLKKQLTGYTMVALEDTAAIRISFENLKWLQDRYPAMKFMITNFLEKYSDITRFIQGDKRLATKEGYAYLERIVEFKLTRVPDIYLASWLGMTLGELREVQNRK